MLHGNEKVSEQVSQLEEPSGGELRYTASRARDITDSLETTMGNMCKTLGYPYDVVELAQGRLFVCYCLLVGLDLGLVDTSHSCLREGLGLVGTGRVTLLFMGGSFLT